MSEENQLDLSQQQHQPEQEQQQQQQEQQSQDQQQETTMSEKLNFTSEDLINQSSSQQIDFSGLTDENDAANKSETAQQLTESFILAEVEKKEEREEEKIDVGRHIPQETLMELEAASREAVDAAICQIARLEEEQERKENEFVAQQQQQQQNIEVNNIDKTATIEAPVEANNASIEVNNEQINTNKHEETDSKTTNDNNSQNIADANQIEEKIQVETTIINSDKNSDNQQTEQQTQQQKDKDTEQLNIIQDQMNEEKKEQPKQSEDQTNATATTTIKLESPIKESSGANESETTTRTEEQQSQNTVNEKEGDETDAVLAVVAAVELAHKSTDSPNKEASGGGVKRKQSSKQHSSLSSPSSSSPASVNSFSALGGGGGDQKRRKKDPLAPKAPLNGYLVYFNEERAGMRAKNPNIGFGELTKIIATKWKELPTDAKQKYINEADQDKERYEKEMASYKKSDAYKQFQKESTSNKLARSDSHPLDRHSNNLTDMKGGGVGLKHQHSLVGGEIGVDHHMTDESPNLSWLQNEANIAGFDVPIFTEEFIEHSKSREHEMRLLRKEVAELEKQSGGMLKHVEGMRSNLASLDSDIARVHAHNDHMHKTLALLRQNLLGCFHKVSATTAASNDRVEFDNLDDYIFKMSSFLKQSPHQHQQQQQFDPNAAHHANYFMHVKSVISKLNFSSLFNSI